MPIRLTEYWDWDELALVFDIISQTRDINLGTATEGEERAEAILRDASIHSQEGYIIVPLNCGQELYDVVEITDALAGLTAVKRRVVSLSHAYAPAKGQYVLRIGLGALPDTGGVEYEG